MVLKNASIALIGVLLMGWSGVSAADEYRPDQFLGLDLSRAVLSPKPLGPPTEFWPFPVEARGDRTSEDTQTGAEPMSEPRLAVHDPKVAVHEPAVVIHKTRVIEKAGITHQRAEKPRGAARTTLARRHGNPLDAQAFDTRVQVWPCKSGGICNWRR